MLGTEECFVKVGPEMIFIKSRTERLTSVAESYLLSQIINNLSETSLSQLFDNLGQVSGDFY